MAGKGNHPSTSFLQPICIEGERERAISSQGPRDRRRDLEELVLGKKHH
jgi:hypothetical protein